MEETARQLCVFEQFGTSKWWIYVEQFEIKCVIPRNINKECSDKVLNLNGLSPDQVSKCVENNGGYDSKKNVLLEKQVRSFRIARAMSSTNVAVLCSWTTRATFTTRHYC